MCGKASATIADNDGDTATDSETIDIASNLVFRDDGPTAVNDGSRGTFEGALTRTPVGHYEFTLKHPLRPQRDATVIAPPGEFSGRA